MADIRIKDLTTEAPNSLTGDFLPIDGGTGTRKLSAYSPTFGGNATVGGTLTVTGVVTAGNAVNASGIIGTTAVSQRITNTSGAFQIYKDATPSLAARFSLNTAASDIAAIGVYNGSSWTDPLQINTTQVLVTTTTASTSTSSGALVVGNGTSGGLGVGGQVSCLGFLLSGNGAPRHANTDATFYSNATSSTTMHIAGFSGGSQSADILKVSLNGISEWLAVKASGQVACYATTASTGTSSGALVVSGGVGVAGAINAGGDIITTKSNGVIKASGSSANAEVTAERLTTTPSSVSMAAVASQPQLAFTSDTAASYTWGRILANSSEIVRVHSANLTAIANVAGAGIAVAGGIINTGSLTTGAPAGGTAAAWKLGTVASVSPTSPNRTIEVDIGGTIYYIHAKTTNN